MNCVRSDVSSSTYITLMSEPANSGAWLSNEKRRLILRHWLLQILEREGLHVIGNRVVSCGLERSSTRLAQITEDVIVFLAAWSIALLEAVYVEGMPASEHNKTVYFWLETRYAPPASKTSETTMSNMLFYHLKLQQIGMSVNLRTWGGSVPHLSEMLFGAASWPRRDQ